MTNADLYTDASWVSNKRGGKCASLFVLDGEVNNEFIWIKNFSRKELVSKYKFLDNTKVVANDLEYVSVFESTQYLLDKNVRDMNITIYTDSIQVFECFYDQCKVKLKNKEFCDVLLVNLSLLKHNNVNIEIRWIKGHAGVYGNSIADYYTRKRTGDVLKEGLLSIECLF